ncbi:uncharacterized protein LOC111024660 [Momordica charantia]|uniref:Uncharacterized protein LOC111024660 n=1 Tax=Momordica charantia TaxID=3673 RepID=A0A6J1E005_MOMCH|nr:uncharacterized protein LOC111024660 [Momordica charantia]
MRQGFKHRDRSNFCGFHRGHGHYTSNCYDLKQQIEGLIRQGYFKKYVGKRNLNDSSKPSSSKNEEKRERSRIPPKSEDQPPMINRIHGEPSDGQSGRKRKELALKARHEVCSVQPKPEASSITLSDADLQGVHLPHNDALVIAFQINHIIVHRVLIDGGASANILTLSTYKALRWGRAQLKKSPTPLVGFSGECVTLDDCIELPISLGEGETQVTWVVEFVVIDGRSAYNAIFGQPILHALKNNFWSAGAFTFANYALANQTY